MRWTDERQNFRPEGTDRREVRNPEPRQALYSRVPGGRLSLPMMGLRQVRVPAGGHVTVHYSVDPGDWCAHLHELRAHTFPATSEPDWGSVVEEVTESERVARYRCGFTSYVAHCLEPVEGLGGEAGEPATATLPDAERAAL